VSTTGGRGGVTAAFTLVLASLPAIPAAIALQDLLFRPSLARDDYRSIAQTIDALARSDDAVILDAPGSRRSSTTTITAAHRSMRCRASGRERARTESELQSISASGGRVFAVLWATEESDPPGCRNVAGRNTFKPATTGMERAARDLCRAAGGRRGGASADERWARPSCCGYTLGADTVAAGDVLPLTLLCRRCNRSASATKCSYTCWTRAAS